MKLKWAEPSEKQIQDGILMFLNYQPGCFAFRVDTRANFDPRLGCYRRLDKTVLPGTPDILCCYHGLFVSFEVKTPTGRQSENQKIFEEKLRSKSNGLYFIVRSVKEVEERLKEINSQRTKSVVPL